jgi:hypothetical protein
MGPKYFGSLATPGYECAAVAELEQLGAAAKVTRRSYAILDQRTIAGARCPTAAALQGALRGGRWQQFVHDVDFFRHRIARWEITMQDWGYNATPVWNLGGSLLAGSGPVDEAGLGLSTLLDVPCLLAMWGFVAWAFGWRTLCVGLVFWGTSLWSGYNWTGGSILRQEWLVASVIGVCLLRKQKLVAGGASITYAALLSIFPGFLAVGVGLKAISNWLHERRLCFAGALIAAGRAADAGLVVPALRTAPAGERLVGFVANSRLDSGQDPTTWAAHAARTTETLPACEGSARRRDRSGPGVRLAARSSNTAFRGWSG